MSLARQGHSANGRPVSGRTRAAGLDFTRHMRCLCEDMVDRVDRLGHIDMARVAISFSQTRKASGYGMYASLTPMRFTGGQTHTLRGGKKWTVQCLNGPDGRQMLYILNFYLPRFLNLKFREKLSTVVHELWHISEKFDGDVRRFEGRCFAHGASQKKYDATVDRLVDRWLSARPPASICEFLRGDFRSLVGRHGRIFGRKFAAPKLFPVK